MSPRTHSRENGSCQIAIGLNITYTELAYSSHHKLNFFFFNANYSLVLFYWALTFTLFIAVLQNQHFVLPEETHTSVLVPTQAFVRLSTIIRNHAYSIAFAASLFQL